MSDPPGKPLDRPGALDEPTIDEFYEHAGCGYLSLNAHGVIVRVNETFLRWTGRTRDELLHGARFSELLTVGARLYFETHCAPMLAAGMELREVALDVRRADGTILLALLGATVHPGHEDGKSAMVRLTVFDASHRRGFERRLVAERDAERRAREHAEGLGRIADRLALLDTSSQIQSAVAGELVGGGFVAAAKVGPRTAASQSSRSNFGARPDGAGMVGLLPVRGPAGEVLGTLRVESDDDFDESDRAFLQAAADLAGRAITRADRTAAKARATRQSPSGGLPNERWWTAALKAELQRAATAGSALTVVVVEISRLEQVTMQQGIGAADQLLLAVSDGWRQAGFDLLSRFGGEEFVVLMPGLDVAQARAAVARVKRVAGAGHQFSVGVAQWDRSESPLSLLSRAEAALLDERAGR